MKFGKEWIKKLEMVFGIASDIAIDSNELTDEQKEKLECSTRIEFFYTKKAKGGPNSYSDNRINMIYVNYTRFRYWWNFNPVSWFYEIRADVLHEIIHILYPHFGEKDVGITTAKWLGEPINKTTVVLHSTSDKNNRKMRPWNEERDRQKKYQRKVKTK